MSKSKTSRSRTPSYGEAAARLEEILKQIEEGEVDIDELSGLVEEAAGLVTLCRDKIQAAEVQVTRITEQLERDESVAGDGVPPASGPAAPEDGPILDPRD